MTDSTRGKPDRGFLLDEWRVAVFVAPDMRSREADELRQQITDELTSWARDLRGRLRLSSVVNLDVSQ
jgi:hypothetical protein